MEDDQQFCLRWNNHQSTLIQNFDTLLESGTLVDCTLAAEGKTLKAHKVVLSACSPYFECLLSEHYDKHPVFILKDVKFKELKAMMDYMYRGEVNISQDQLAALLKAAESLQIKGLSESKTAGSSKTESRPQKTVSQTTAPSLDIPHASSGLTIEKNKVPRQAIVQGSVGDMPEDTASPQTLKRVSSSSPFELSREGSQSPISRKRKRFRRRSLGEDSTMENPDASDSSEMPQQMGVPALGIAPVADEKVHADSTDSLGRSALMTQLTKPADEMLQLPLEKPEPSDNLIEPKSEYLEDPEEGVEDLTLDDDMNDLNDIEQDNNRAGPSHDPAQHPAGLGAWHVTGDRSNAGGVVGSVAGAPGTTDEVFLAAQEAAQQAQRDSQEKENSSGSEEIPLQNQEDSWEKKILLFEKEEIIWTDEETFCDKEENSLVMEEWVSWRGKERSRKKKMSKHINKESNLTNGKVANTEPIASTSTEPIASTSTNKGHSKHPEVIRLTDDSQSDNDNSLPWMDTKNISDFIPKFTCPHCGDLYYKRENLLRHITTTCLANPESKNNKDAGKFRCEDCGRSYTYAKSLRHHQRHECRQTVTCPDCGKKMRGIYVTDRHKQNYCVNKQRTKRTNRDKKVKREPSPDELFIDDSSFEFN